MKNKLLWALIVAATVAIAASLLESWGAVSLPTAVPVILRWVAIALLAAYAGARRSLTAWILVGTRI
jgi:biotin transporter BioY